VGHDGSSWHLFAASLECLQAKVVLPEEAVRKQNQKKLCKPHNRVCVHGSSWRRKIKSPVFPVLQDAKYCVFPRSSLPPRVIFGCLAVIQHCFGLAVRERVCPRGETWVGEWMESERVLKKYRKEVDPFSAKKITEESTNQRKRKFDASSLPTPVQIKLP